MHGPVRLRRKQTTSRPDSVWPDVWKHVSDASKRKAKQKWAIEKPKLDNVYVADLTSCRGTVQAAWQKPPVRRKGRRTGLPARVSGRHVVRRTDRRHLSWKCAQVTGKDGENGQHSGEMGGSSLSPGSPASRAPLHGDGSMYSQAVIVGTEKVLREIDGPVEGSTKKSDSGGMVIALGCVS